MGSAMVALCGSWEIAVETVSTFAMVINGHTYRVSLTRRDQYNDHSVAYDWYVVTENGSNGHSRQYPMTGEHVARIKYADAVSLLRQRAVRYATTFHVAS